MLHASLLTLALIATSFACPNADALPFPQKAPRECAWTCADNRLKLLSTTFNADKTKTVIVDASGCKGSTISWLCSRTANVTRVACNGFSDEIDQFSTKCDEVLTATFVMPESMPEIAIQMHDGQLAGDFVLREDACGGIKGSCPNGYQFTDKRNAGFSGVCTQLIAVPLPPPPPPNFIAPVKCGDWRCDTVKPNCAVVSNINPLPNGTKDVTVDVSGCKGSTISWMCCQTPGCQINNCNGNTMFDPVKQKCNEVNFATYNVPNSATSLTIQYHDGKLFGDVISNAVGFATCGGVGGSCSSPTGVCSKTLAL